MSPDELTNYVYNVLADRVRQHNENPTHTTVAKLEVISVRGRGGTRFKGWRISYRYPVRTSRKDRKKHQGAR